jgi:hypothetical protein
MLLTESSLRKIIRQALIEAKDQNSDGKNDFRDVKIARMKASGLSKAAIEKKYPDLYEDEEVDLEDDEFLLTEPDLSSEDGRSKDVDEISTLAGGSIRGYQVPLGHNNKKR